MEQNGVNQFGIHFDHLGIHVASIDRSIEWYGRMFGLERIPKRTGYQQGPFPRMDKTGQKDFLLEIYEVQNALASNSWDYEMTEGIKHFGLKIKHFDAWLAYARAQGVSILMEERNGPGDSRVFIQDPDGIVIECLQDPDTAGNEQVTDALPKAFGIRIDHVAMHVHDAESTARWYHAMYGFEKLGAAHEPHPGMMPRVQWLVQKNVDFKLEIFEVQEARPYNYVDYEYVIGLKHMDFGIVQRSAWLKYVKENVSPEIVVEITYTGDGGAIYFHDNSGFLVETNKHYT